MSVGAPRQQPGVGIVASDHFILATRDAGYRSVAAAIAELVDNAIQASATDVGIFVQPEDAGDRSIQLAVLDNGHGMAPDAMQAALQFGGSSRFNERTGVGRFGMGLPNSSVSQARRVDVFSWTEGAEVWSTYLDVDEVADGTLRSIPCPIRRNLPYWATRDAAASGTLVLWTRCDRLSGSPRTIVSRLRASLSRWYRYPLWDGIAISVNEVLLAPIDPLFLHERSAVRGAVLFGPPLRYEFQSDSHGTALVEVRFTELPVTSWRDRSSDDKRRLGVIGRAGVSVVRASREIDYGWHLMGAKRRENYDDWWRCEIRFTPGLDELFGVTHSKQGIKPSPDLRRAIEPELEAVARTLNSRARVAFQVTTKAQSTATNRARESDQVLPPPFRARTRSAAAGMGYQIRVAALNTPAFYAARLVKGILELTLNCEHPFYLTVYSRLGGPNSQERFYVESLLLGAARASLEASTKAELELLERLEQAWGDALAAFLER